MKTEEKKALTARTKYKMLNGLVLKILGQRSEGKWFKSYYHQVGAQSKTHNRQLLKKLCSSESVMKTHLNTPMNTHTLRGSDEQTRPGTVGSPTHGAQRAVKGPVLRSRADFNRDHPATFRSQTHFSNQQPSFTFFGSFYGITRCFNRKVFINLMPNSDESVMKQTRQRNSAGVVCWKRIMNSCL